MKEIFYNKFKLLTTLSQINMYHEENQPIEENRELHEKYKEIQTVYNILTEAGFEYEEKDDFLMSELSTDQKIVLKTLEKHKGAYDEAPIITIFELVRKLREEKANSHSTAYHAYINLSKSEEVELLKIFLDDQYEHLGVKL